MRWVAAFCLALVSVMGTAQAVHTHGSLLLQKTAVVHVQTAGQLDDNEASCPLCTAMHSVLPAPLRAGLPPPVLDAILPAGLELSASEAHWAFALFSRPPPVRA
jgi:hypothetical protein